LRLVHGPLLTSLARARDEEVTRVLTNVIDVATTGVVASARPASVQAHGTAVLMTGALCRPRTATTVAPDQGSGLPVFTGFAGDVSALEARTYRTQTSTKAVNTKAVTTQDPQHPVSGKQLKGHQPV
jgi:hypothetical protein